MSRPASANVADRPSSPGRDPEWVALAHCEARVPPPLLPWLAEPGLLTARVRAACGAATVFRLLGVAEAVLAPGLARRLGVADQRGTLREIEFTCGKSRWIFAQSVFPASTVQRYPWLRDIGESPLGEVLRRAGDVQREPLEYRELGPADELARAALGTVDGTESLWARRAVYRLAGAPIVVQEVFLPALGRCG